MSVEDLQDKIALRVVQNGLITLDGVIVPETNRLQGATSFRGTAKVLKLTRAGVAWMAVGFGLGAFEHALAYASERHQFGRPIAGFQLVQDLLVRMLGNCTTSACLCLRLAQLAEAGEDHDEHSALAKAVCTVRMRETVGWARELMGGNGILLDHHVGRFVADAEALYSYEGTREMNTLDRRTQHHRHQRLRLTGVRKASPLRFQQLAPPSGAAHAKTLGRPFGIAHRSVG